MNPALMQLLGGFIGDATPQLNQQYDPTYDPTQPGNSYTDPRAQRYQTPGFGTKVFHPGVAAYESEQNLSPANAAYQNTIQSRIGAGNTATARGGYGLDVSDPNLTNESLYRLTGGNPTASELYNVNTRAAEQRAGVPAAGARRELLGNEAIGNEFGRAIEASPLMDETYRTQAKLNLANTEGALELQPQQFELEKAQLVNRLKATTNLDPVLLANEVENATRESKRLPTKNEEADIISNVKLQQAKREQQMEATRTEMIPFAQQELRNRQGMATYESQFGATPASPVAMRIRNGQVGAELAPGYVGSPQMNQAAAMMQTGIPKLPPRGVYINGKPVSIGGRYSALTGEPVGEEPITAPPLTMDDRLRRLIDSNHIYQGP